MKLVAKMLRIGFWAVSIVASLGAAYRAVQLVSLALLLRPLDQSDVMFTTIVSDAALCATVALVFFCLARAVDAVTRDF